MKQSNANRPCAGTYKPNSPFYMRLAALDLDKSKTLPNRQLNTFRVPEARDGQLAIVSKDATKAFLVPKNRYRSLCHALEDWQHAEPFLSNLSQQLESGEGHDPASLISPERANFMAPIPRCYGFFDASAFLSHVILARKARGAELPADLETVPIMYQGISDGLLGPDDPIPLSDPALDLDLEGEFGVIVDDVPCGVSPLQAASHIKLLCLFNDISLRALAKRETASGFGFIQAKPASAFAPLAVTPEELGPAWQDGRIALDIVCKVNGKLLGSPNGRQMHFSFPQLIAHAARTRSLSAGTIIGGGTVSNNGAPSGVACIVEQRMLEASRGQNALTPFLKAGDRIEIDCQISGRSIFGRINQTVVAMES